MAFIKKIAGRDYSAGYFMESEVGLVRKTRQIKSEGATDIDGEKYVLAGTVYPSNDESAEGIVYETINVTNGDEAGSVVVGGRVWEDQLPTAIAPEAKTALEGKGFVFIAHKPATIRP